jgi:hypothetical protein
MKHSILAEQQKHIEWAKSEAERQISSFLFMFTRCSNTRSDEHTIEMRASIIILLIGSKNASGTTNYLELIAGLFADNRH